MNRYENTTVAVTGASGYLASVLIDAIKRTPARIVRVSRAALAPLSGTEALQADIRLKDCWERIVATADVIFHLAGNTSVYHAAKDPADSLNSTVLPITHLVAATRAAGRRPRVVFASTATVYGLPDRLPVSEEQEPHPVTIYDLHKLFAERQLELASKHDLLEGVCLRLANVYGPSAATSSASDRGILNRISTWALQGRSLRLYGDGNYLRDYVYVEDVARAFVAAGASPGVSGRSFNVASGKGTTVRDAFALVADRAAAVTGRRVGIESVPWPEDADPIEFRNFVAATTGLAGATGWQPTIDLNEGIDRMISSISGRRVT